MASRRQIIANRRNARRSTGPRTLSGKLRSRRNAVRHGLTGETIIDVFESREEYECFEKSMTDAYRPRSVIEHELVVRLSSLLWRLRRATAIETGLFSIQAQIIWDRKTQRNNEEVAAAGSRSKLYAMLDVVSLAAHTDSDAVSDPPNSSMHNNTKTDALAILTDTEKTPAMRPEMLAQCFLRVARLDNNILERISRYEVGLWKQAAHIAIKLHQMQNVIQRNRERKMKN